SSLSPGLPAPVPSAGRMPVETGWKPVPLPGTGSGFQCAKNLRRILSPILRFGFAGLAGLAALLPASASACAACFGQSDSPMAKGMNAGIFTLLLVITSVLLGVAIFFAYILRRAARLSAAAQRFHVAATVRSQAGCSSGSESGDAAQAAASPSRDLTVAATLEPCLAPAAHPVSQPTH
ncbi:MAG: hypothetical protein ACREUU_09195, partial [Gammaproteobacteria bacterium]